MGGWESMEHSCFLHIHSAYSFEFWRLISGCPNNRRASSRSTNWGDSCSSCLLLSLTQNQQLFYPFCIIVEIWDSSVFRCIISSKNLWFWFLYSLHWVWSHTCHINRAITNHDLVCCVQLLIVYCIDWFHAICENRSSIFMLCVRVYSLVLIWNFWIRCQTDILKLLHWRRSYHFF